MTILELRVVQKGETAAKQNYSPRQIVQPVLIRESQMGFSHPTWRKLELPVGLERTTAMKVRTASTSSQENMGHMDGVGQYIKRNGGLAVSTAHSEAQRVCW